MPLLGQTDRQITRPITRPLTGLTARDAAWPEATIAVWKREGYRATGWRSVSVPGTSRPSGRPREGSCRGGANRHHPRDRRILLVQRKTRHGPCGCRSRPTDRRSRPGAAHHPRLGWSGARWDAPGRESCTPWACHGAGATPSGRSGSGLVATADQSRVTEVGSFTEFADSDMSAPDRG